MQHYFFKLSRIKNVNVLRVSNYSIIRDMVKFKTTDVDSLLDPKVIRLKDKLLYCDYIEKRRLRFGFKENLKIKSKLRYKFQKEINLKNSQSPAISIALKYLSDENEHLNTKSNCEKEDEEQIQEEQELENIKPIHMPYAAIDKYEEVQTESFLQKKPLPLINEKFRLLYEKYLEVSKYSTENPNLNGMKSYDNINKEIKIRLGDDLANVSPSWMTDYEVYDDALEEDYEGINYGTPDSKSEISTIPCGGCGALLHCKDVALPGYLPSELFSNKNNDDLKSVICQRCHFMKNYNTCLDVRVSADDYPKLLEKINENRRALVLLLVDLTDFPCSIWPQLPSLIGEKRHVFVVGNKIDLLPKDSPHFQAHVKDSLTESLIQCGITKSNIKHIGLISAKTGYGVEDLINKLNRIWQYRSDVYLLGCTNAGKSTLFNTLLQSDFCKSQAVDIVQRATTSPWPGTTLNLLKFPILKMASWKNAFRYERLKKMRLHEHADTVERIQELKKTKNIEFATLQSRITHSFKRNYDLNNAFSKLKVNDMTVTLHKPKMFGLDETAPEYASSHWCYDTPGAIQPDQILHLLTTDELIKTLPSRIISPRTFCVWPGQTIFIAGLGRLDIMNAPSYIRCTVFASNRLPITMCKTENAEIIYNELLQSEAFEVPINNPDRLKMWPKLESKYLETIGIGDIESVADVLLSNAGWIAITAKKNEKVEMKGWTPEGRGIYLRTPALLPKSVTLRGIRQLGSPSYRLGRQVYTPKKMLV